MATSITSGQVTVTTSPTLLYTVPDNQFVTLHLFHPATGNKDVWLGTSAVSITTGYDFPTNTAQEYTFEAGMTLYAITETGTEVVTWLAEVTEL